VAARRPRPGARSRWRSWPAPSLAMVRSGARRSLWQCWPPVRWSVWSRSAPTARRRRAGSRAPHPRRHRTASRSSISRTGRATAPTPTWQRGSPKRSSRSSGTCLGSP
jgi:hypothetical protein